MARGWVTWEQFSRAWKLALGTGVIVWAVVVTAREEPSSLPYLLVAGLVLLGVSISFPWERRKDDDT